MLKEVNYNQYADKAIEVLSKGAFLTTAADGEVNTMTIAWGSIGFIWAKPVFMVMVRPSRHTYNLIEKSGEFTVSIPLKDMQQALAICGTKSGRDMDKFAAAGLTTLAGQKLATPVIANCGLHFECKIVYKQAMTDENLDSEINAKKYSTGDYHTLYFGEIVATYIEE
ncbi:flavin reductase family protein [Dendrosporobacter sp. 1207_IL3150]|uniref:flavin reductase family protein n=1 Tax=Dendrosporobacter sp. 1207_IL3150 TaxID=3084054 RepID=UPI002FD97903